MKFSRLSLLSVFVPSIAFAHIDISSGNVNAGKAAKVTFAINHGCKIPDANDNTVEHELDTLSIQIDIPAGVDGKSVRAMPSDFGGTPVMTKDADGAITSVKWTRDTTDLQPQDSLGYYEITLKITVPDAPFTRIPFVVTQTCMDGSTPVVVAWDDGEEPAPRLTVLPQHESGWNKITLSTAVAFSDFKYYFNDAAIVWKGTSAFSKNAVVSMLITMTPGVTPLDSDLAAGDEIWVKY